MAEHSDRRVGRAAARRRRGEVHGDRHIAAVTWGSAAELPEVVVAPACHAAAAGECAGVAAAHRDRRDAAREARHVYRDVRVGPCAIPELAVHVGAAPALDPAAACDRAASTARGDRAHAVHEAGDVDWSAALGDCTVPESTVAPALDPTAARECARVAGASRDRADPAGEAHDVHRDAAVSRCAVPEAAVVIEAPTLDPAAAREHARVVAAGGDRADPAREARDVDRDGAGGVCAVAELAPVTLAPTLDPAAARERARYRAARGDRADPARDARDVDRNAALGRRAVAELARAVGSPALDATASRERAAVRVAQRDRGDRGADGRWGCCRGLGRGRRRGCRSRRRRWRRVWDGARN